jgi:hypothetical protein
VILYPKFPLSNGGIWPSNWGQQMNLRTRLVQVMTVALLAAAGCSTTSESTSENPLTIEVLDRIYEDVHTTGVYSGEELFEISAPVVRKEKDGTLLFLSTEGGRDVRLRSRLEDGNTIACAIDEAQRSRAPAGGTGSTFISPDALFSQKGELVARDVMLCYLGDGFIGVTAWDASDKESVARWDRMEFSVSRLVCVKGDQ